MLTFQLAACDIIDTRTITDTIQNTIDSVSQQSDAWRAALPDLTDTLRDIESKASGDIKVTVGDTINQVSALQKQTFDQAATLTKDTIAFTLIQAQCSVSYFQQAVMSYLRYLKAWVTNRAAPLPAQRVCNFNPDHVDVDPNTPADSNKTWPINVYGYNFFPNALPRVQLLDGNNQFVRNAQNQPVPTSLYQIELQLVAADFAPIALGYRIGFVWANGDRNFISLNLSAPANLSVKTFDFPGSITVNQPVVPRITISNSGTIDSGAFAISWTPDSTRGSVVTSTKLGIPGGQTQSFDLPAFTYAQVDYFNVPRTSSMTGLQTIVQILGNAGVGSNSQMSRVFALNNLAFHPLARVVIANPNVGANWTNYELQVPVRAGDIVTIVSAGGCVQTGGTGATWKRYVNPDASDQPNLYHGLVSIRPIMPFDDSHPPAGMKRIQDMIGVPIAVPLNTNNPQFYVGYEDGNYTDNGYQDHDDGTNNQCAGSFGAFVTVQIQRN